MPLFLVYALCAFAGGFAARLMDPLVLPVAQHFAVTPAAAAVLATAYALPYAAFQPFLGPLGDRYGKGRCMQACIAGCTIALALGVFAPTFPLLLATRAAAGMFAGGLVPLVLASLGDRYALVERQVMIGRMLFAVIGGQTLGSTIAGLANSAWGWRSALAAAALVGIVATLAAWRGMPRPAALAAGAAPAASFRTLYARVFANPKAGWVYGCVIAESVLFFGAFPFVGTLLAERTQGGVDDISRQAGLVLGAFGLGGLVYAIAVRRLIAWLGTARMCAVGAAVAAACYAALPLLHAWWLHAIAMGAAGLAFNMIHNSLQTQATELAPTARGSAVALFAAGLFAGQGLGPLLFGPLTHVAGFAPTLWLVALGMLVLGAAVRKRVLR